VRRLRRQPGRQAAVLADGCGRRARLERRRRHPLADDPAGDDDLAALEEALVRLVRSEAMADVRAHLREQQHLVARRIGGVDDHRQLVVVDVDELGGVDALGPLLREDDGDDLADEADDVLGEHGPGHPRVDARKGHGDRGEVDVCCREDPGAVDRVEAACVDAHDAGVREGRADEGGMAGARQREVVDVAAPAGEEAWILPAKHSLTDHADVVTLPSRFLRSRVQVSRLVSGRAVGDPTTQDHVRDSIA
jgi:hypothetical protein